MTTLVLPGNPDSALAMLAPVGLSAILDEAGLGPVTFLWDESRRPSRPSIQCRAENIDQIAQAVRAHAQRHTSADSWVQARIERLSNAGKGLFSPRSSVSPQQWELYLVQREDRLRQLESGMSTVDWALVTGLGEPAWWRAADKDGQPDKGASRWEMKTRNAGQEFIVHRLQPLADAVAKRSREGIAGGLTGDVRIDECGKDRDTSRTPTGLTVPMATDCVLAWIALWGLVSLPVIARSTSGVVNGYSQSPGTYPRHRVHPDQAALPFVVQPHTWRSFRALMMSREFDIAAFGTVREVAQTDVNRAVSWLSEQGVGAIVRFPVEQRGSASAPERVILSGTLEACRR